MRLFLTDTGDLDADEFRVEVVDKGLCTHEQANNAFKKLDKDGTGRLELKEMKQFYRAMDKNGT